MCSKTLIIIGCLGDLNGGFIFKGVVILDLEERDLPGVVYRVVEQMVMEELILAEDKSSVMRALMLRHRPVDSERFRFSVRRNTLAYTSLQVD